MQLISGQCNSAPRITGQPSLAVAHANIRHRMATMANKRPTLRVVKGGKADALAPRGALTVWALPQGRRW
jgi:hypothetical protein